MNIQYLKPVCYYAVIIQKHHWLFRWRTVYDVKWFATDEVGAQTFTERLLRKGVLAKVVMEVLYE